MADYVRFLPSFLMVPERISLLDQIFGGRKDQNMMDVGAVNHCASNALSVPKQIRPDEIAVGGFRA